MSYQYQHSQPAVLLWAITGIVVIFCLMLAIGLAIDDAYQGDVLPGMLMLALPIVAILAFFHSLTVKISADELRLAFGIGLIRKRFTIADIQSVSVVKNHWYQGWGIRKIRSGWLYNVSGFDAVEISLRNGRCYRIGTDQPRELCRAIEAAIAPSA